jgi:pimeloyl-ACP methyl ester carboxylesterase
MTKHRFKSFAYLFLVLSLFLFATGCGGGSSDDRSPVDFTNGATLQGSIDGAPFKIAVPPADEWNGILLMHVHGYRDRARTENEVENRLAEAAPGGEALEDALVAQGFAVAGSAFSKNGWAVEEGIVDTLNLTEYFKQRFATPQATVLLGVSMGSNIALKSIELFPDLYQGVIGLCSVGAGATRNFDLALGVLLAYDIMYGLPESLGFPTNISSNFDFDNDFAPEILRQTQVPEGQVGLEFIRLVSNITSDAFAADLFSLFFFATEALSELIDRAGGSPIQNLNASYSIPDLARIQLESLGFPASQILAGMNQGTVFQANPDSREYLVNNADYSGNHNAPVLLMHTTDDGFVLPANQEVYIDLLSSQGRAAQVFGTYVDSVGHCNFTGQQIGATVAAMGKWLAAGIRPSAADFPEALGFNNNYTPAPFPY